MNRRHFIASSSLLAASTLLPIRRLFAGPRAGTFTPLRRGVGFFEGQGGTIGWLATDDALVVVDSQFPESAEECWAGLQTRTEHSLDLLLNTHHHGDHTGGNTVFQPHAAQIVAHRNVPDLQKASAEQRGNEDAQAYATETYEDVWRQDVGDESIQMRYYGPAHTSGDSVILFENANVAHMGDLVFNRRPGFIDVAGGASSRGWVSVLESVHADFSDETLFIFGHSNPAFEVTGSRADLLAMRDFMSALIEFVEAGMKEGKTEDQIAETTKLPGFETYYLEDQPDGIPRSLRAVYQDLAG